MPTSYPGFTLAKWGSKGRAAGPVVVQALDAALDAGLTDFRLTGPLNVLVAMDDPSLLPALRAIEGKAKRKAKTAIQEMLTKLARNEPAPAAKATKASTSTPKSAGAKKAADPERDALAKHCADAGFSAARVAELVGLARNRIVLEPAKKGASGLGENRFGGEPDLPRGATWPVVRLTKTEAKEQLFQELAAIPHAVDGKHVIMPLGFVAQLRLETLAPLDLDGKLPKAGLLSFFARQDIQPGEHGELFRITATVLFHEDTGDLVPHSPPADVQKRDRHPACAIKLTREIPLAPPPFAYALGLVNDESSRYDTLYGKSAASPPFGALGYARAAYYRGLPSRNETLLLQVASGDGTGFGWGDDSSIFFLIADAALKKRDFAKAVCVADEC